MRLNDSDDLSNVEDRRGEEYSGGGGGGGFGGLRLGFGGFVLLAILSLIFGRNFFSMVPRSGGGDSRPVQSTRTSRDTPKARERMAAEEDLRKVAISTFNDAQKTWATLLPQQANVSYQPAKLVLFWDATHSGCGAAGAEVGPFYCPADTRVFIDLAFYRELAKRFKAPGDFAQAYVIAHEIGHHVQNLIGVERKVRAGQRRDPRAANALSVRMELQADCLAGVWAHGAAGRNLLEPGDMDEGLRAAAAVGDDEIQKMGGGRVRPETWTHGAAAQRQRWFRRGFDSGDLSACDTFAAPSP